MLIIYFLLGLGMTTAHSDYGVSSRAQNFDKTVQNIDKEAYIKHQREKRFVTGYSVPQNGTNRPSWGSNSSRDFVANVTRFQHGNRPSGFNVGKPNTDAAGASKNQRVASLVDAQKANEQNVIVNYPAKNTTGLTLIKPRPNGNMTDVTGRKYVNPGQNYNTNVTWPVYPTYNYIKVRPGYNINGNNTSNASGYTIPVNSVTPGNTPYPGYPGYPAPNTSYTVPNTSYPAPNTGYPAQNTGYPAPNTGYPASNTNPGQNYNTSVTRPVYPSYYNNIIVRPANKTNFNNSNPSGYNVLPVNPVKPGNTSYYPVPNTGYPSSTSNLAPNTAYPAPNNGYPASSTVYPAPNSGYRVPNTGYPGPNNGYSAPSGYPVPNTFYPPPSSVIPPANATGFVPKPNPGFTIHDAVPRNNTNGFNNTATWENCKCKLPRANSTITKEERTMDACMIICDNCPAGMKMSAFGVCVKDLDYDDE